MKYIFNHKLLLILLIFFGSCNNKEKKQLIYLIDLTVYGNENMKRELKKELNKYRDIIDKKNYTAFKKIRNLSISYILVDDQGANSSIDCTTIQAVPGREYKKLKDSVDSIEKCFSSFKDIGKDPTKYQKTLYLQALSKALDELEKNKESKKEVIIIGDLAIVDKYCSLEEKMGCRCHSYDKLNIIKDRIKNIKDLTIKFIPVNIPGEESCLEKRRKIWNTLSIVPAR